MKQTSNTMTEAMQRMIKGRVGLIAREPFFATLALSKLELIEDSSCESSWVDGRRLGFNPDRVLAADSMDEIEAIWAHHVATCALGHPFRRGAREIKLWNEASDHCVNSYITKAGFHLPEGSVYDSRFDGMYAEQIYTQLAQERQPPESDNGGGQSESGDDSSAQATGEVRDAPSGDEAEQQPASPAEMAEQEGDWQTAVAQAAQAARGAGKLGGGTDRIAQAGVSPRVEWREALQRLLRARSKDDYNLRKPSRRHMMFGLLVASLDSPRCGPLAFAIDYSGSIQQSQIDQFTAEVQDAAATLNPERVIVLAFDHGVKSVLEFAPSEPIELPPVCSGGGTSFIEPVLKMNDYEVEPEVLVFLTDLDSSRFAPEPDYPVVWVTTQPGTAPYGEIINMY